MIVLEPGDIVMCIREVKFIDGTVDWEAFERFEFVEVK